MSILIKGIEMPKDRPVRIDLYPNGKALLFTTASEWVTEHTVIELPPHGRIIDADAVYKRLQKQAMTFWGISGDPRYTITLEIMDAIRFAPTIIEAEEAEQ